jgi:hypothetical protein
VLLALFGSPLAQCTASCSRDLDRLLLWKRSCGVHLHFYFLAVDDVDSLVHGFLFDVFIKKAARGLLSLVLDSE